MPTQKPSSKPANKAPLKLIFFYIVAFGALYVSIVSYLNLLFAYVNVKFPDQLDFTYTSSLNRIRWATSVLVVVWALYVSTQWLITKELKNHKTLPEKSGHKLLTYLTLLLATITIAVDLITLLYNFYSGGFTISFTLKVISVFVVAAAVFGYYRWELRQLFGKKTRLPLTVGWIATIALILSIVAGFFIVGSPLKQRDIRFDEERVQDLQEIQSQVISHWQLKDELPDSLTDLTDSISGYQVPSDPESGEDYSYTKTGELSFELCADFKTDGKYSSSLYSSRPLLPAIDKGTSNNWEYKVGTSCYKREIDPEIYKSSSETPIVR